ncbi:MAG: response regulator transcription factor [Nannocystaceae bacterium]
MKIRIVLADDQKLFREGLRMLLSTDPRLVLVAEASDGQQAVDLVEQHRPDVVLMDLRMPRMGGVEATQRLKRLGSRARIIALTTFSDEDLVFDAIRAGAVSYLLKDAGADVIVSAVVAAAAGESVIAPSVAVKILAEFSRMASLVPQASSFESLGLTEREGSILRLLARGTSNKGIARQLSIAEGTVKNHLSAVYKKLGVNDRTEAAIVARQYSLG